MSEDQHTELQFSVDPQIRKQLTKEILARYGPLTQSDFSLATDLSHRSVTAIIPQEHVFQLLQICLGIDPHGYDGFGEANVAHSDLACIVWHDLCEGMCRSAQSLYASHELPDQVTKKFRQWQHLIEEEYRIHEAGIVIPHGDTRVIIGFQGFGQNLEKYEVANTSFFLVTQQAAEVLTGIQGLVSEEQVVVASYQPETVKYGEGRRQLPARTRISLTQLIKDITTRSIKNHSIPQESLSQKDISFYVRYAKKDGSVKEAFFSTDNPSG